MVTVRILKDSFKKLLSYSYFDKTDMVLRKNIATFAQSLANKTDEEAIFHNIISVANGENEEQLNSWLQQVQMRYYPKKLKSNKKNESHLITNIPPFQAEVERLLIKAEFPVELLIIDVAWVLMYGYHADSDLSDDSWGNRLDLIANKSGVKKGNALFKKYQNQYSSWWRNGLKKANEHLRDHRDVTIITFDITNCYHSIDFRFDQFFTDYESSHPHDGMREDPVTQVLCKMYERYWTIVQKCGEEVFQGANYGKQPLPLALMSAHIFANWYLKPLDKYVQNNYQTLYYGRYVDDCMVVKITTSQSEEYEESIGQELPGMLIFEDDKARFAFAQEEFIPVDNERLATLEVQKDKVYVYRFNSQLPPASLDEFEEEQKERSSEYRFLTDEADLGGVSLENATLISALDAEEEAGRRFNILEENKYRLAVYLAKLASRLAKFGKGYEHYEEVEKVFHYFKGSLLIKHYVLWERLMTVFVLAEKKEYVDQFVDSVKHQIDQLAIKDDLFVINKADGLHAVRESLLLHLEESRTMALSLNKGDSDIKDIYLNTFMVRMHYNALPMQEFAKGFATEGVRLQTKGLVYYKKCCVYRWIPYYVKYFDLVCMLSWGETYDPDLFERAFRLYLFLNHLSPLGASAFCHNLTPQEPVTEFNTHLSIDEPDHHNNFTVAVVNMDLKDSEGDDQITKFGQFDNDKAITMQKILDKITEIGDTDIFILPEMSLPLYELREYCLYASKNQVAFVAGMEYVVINKYVYNYTITCLPITLYGRRDAVPVIRLKNHYAPEEKRKIVTGHHHKLPKKKDVFQNLYHWHDHVFTTYYCYELTNILERSFFFSKIDAMYCPVFNPDTYYFNNIAESMVRDMHCYFILANVSKYGDSRVTQPTKHDLMNLLKVKGGNTKNNKAVVLTAVLEIDKLRGFQLLDEDKQKKDGTFKITPPGFDKTAVTKRKCCNFIFKFDDPTDEFLANLNRMLLEY